MKRRKPQQPPPGKPPPEEPSAGRQPLDDGQFTWRTFLGNIAIGQIIGPAVRLMAAVYLAIASLVLVMAWQFGPQRMIDADRLQSYTDQKDARIVESWVAFDLDPSRMGSSTHWRGFARATPCAIVEYEGEWGSMRRAFCGTRWLFHRELTLHDLREMSPGVPFDFARDANGFSIPELRMGKPALEYLGKQKSIWGTFEERRMKYLGHYTSLDELRTHLDRPVDLAIVSWSQPPPSFPLAIDPRHPADALPAGFVAARRAAEPIWPPLFIGGIVGLAFWFAGMNVLLFNLVPLGRLVLGALPLFFLPWWAEELPRQLRHLDAEVASTLADELGDIDLLSRVVVTEPDEAAQHGGERVRFGVADGLYADTFGRLRFVPPKTPPANADAALAALAAATADQVRKMPPEERADLFSRLKSEKEAILYSGGLVFLPAAKEAMNDANAGAEVQRAGYRFLSEWMVVTTAEPLPDEPAFRERVRLYRAMTDIPVTVIAYPARLIAERAEKRAVKTGG